jgi:hypothetical protein
MVMENEARTVLSVTEIYKKQGKERKLSGLTFSSVRDAQTIAH